MTPQDPNIPYGYCWCGCGTKTNIAPWDSSRHGWVKGRPHRFIQGHQFRVLPPPSPVAPFKIDGVYCRLIPLNHGQYAIVDEADYNSLAMFKWFARRAKNTDTYYAVRNVKMPDGSYKTLLMHHQILGIRRIDHADAHNTLDNRRKNLRSANASQNGGNRRKNKNNTSGFKGVSYRKDRGKWVASTLR